jgi:small subunit ribosomal protein S20
MPIIKSAKKRVRVAEKAAIRNSKTKRSLRTALKSFQKAVTGGDKDVATKHNDAQSNLDKAVKKGILHKNKVARMKSQLAAKAKASATAAPVKKAAPKKAASTTKAAKPAAAKKPAVKKAAAKKPAAKK